MKKKVIIPVVFILIFTGCFNGCTTTKQNPLLQDSDNDGHADSSDAFPSNPFEWLDSDGDYVGDNSDAFPLNATENKDTDDDGVGDNSDKFPNDRNEQYDSDNDGVGDNADVFPYDPTEIIDSDGDGIGDNADAYPNNPNIGYDTDQDGVADNYDAFPNDSTQWLDIDQDGYGNNVNGKNPDLFPYNPTEWNDSDNDNYGDNSDFFDTGNGVIKLQIKDFHCDSHQDESFVPDPSFIILISAYSSGELQSNYSDRADYINSTYQEIPVSIEVDIEDNTDLVQILIEIRDADILSTQKQIHINNSFLSFYPQETRYQRYRLDGREDGHEEIDAWFNLTIQIKYCDCP